MNRTGIVIVLVFSFLLSRGQKRDLRYQSLIARAGLFHLQKDVQNAVVLYDSAFSLQRPAALDAYKAAAMYALAGESEKSFQYLEWAIVSGWTETSILEADPYFDSLKITHPAKWKKVEELAQKTERAYEKKLSLPGLRQRINQITLTDQSLRYRRIQARSKIERQTLNELIRKADSANLSIARNIIAEYGWPKRSAIGNDGQNNLWLIVQHADSDPVFQKKVLSLMKPLLALHEADPENYAFLYDCVLCNLNDKQWFGTQVVWSTNGKASGFRSILKEHEAGQRRRAIGLLPLSVYSLTYGFNYSAPTRSQALRNDKADLKKTNQLIDSANYFFRKKEFQKVYDFYNEASAIQGGMTDAQNFSAAVVFAKIAALDTNEQYRSIALDFLHLLALKQVLTNTELLAEKAFVTLYGEPRWKEIIQHN